MFCKTTIRAGLCVLLLIVASCSTPENVTSKGPEEVSGIETTKVSESETTKVSESATAKVSESETAKVSGVETAKAESDKEAISEASEVIISLGDKKLTMEQVMWAVPNGDEQKIAQFAKWWLENELLYDEAERRGITKEPKAKFMAKLMKRRVFSQELALQVRDAVKISDEKALEYYEKNKDTDARLKEPGRLSFSHIRTKTLKEAQRALKKIKGGEAISELAKELSIDNDAKKGGKALNYVYGMTQRRFGKEFFEALVGAKEGELIGPIKVRNGYEVARQEGKIEPKVLPFETVKEQIRLKLERTEKANALKSLLDSLTEEAADKVVKSPRLIQAEKAVSPKGSAVRRPQVDRKAGSQPGVRTRK